MSTQVETPVITKTFVNNQYKRIDAELTVQIFSDGKVKIALKGKNNRLFGKAFVNAVVNVTYIDEGQEVSEGTPLYYQHLPTLKMTSKLGKFFDENVDATSTIDYAKEDTIILDHVTLSDDVMDSDPALAELDQQIENLGRSVRETRVLYGVDSDEYKAVSEELQNSKQKRFDYINSSITSKKLAGISITAELNVDT